MIRDNKERGDFYKALHALEHKEKISKDEIEELFRNFSIPKEEFIKAILQHFNEVARGSFPEDDKDWTAAYIIVNNVDKEGLRIDIILDKY
ncbi:MAG: hypothetical protein LBO09_04565 [Candidatus Peribacteria bacterium]|jgi:hypothetical protein|nr:hypothetical protein [Candidatus Peribacteria bacterium]